MNQNNHGVSFSSILLNAMMLLSRRPLVWIGYCIVQSLLLTSGRISLALGIFTAVTCLLVGVSIAAWIDNNPHTENKPIAQVVQSSLPLAMSMATMIVICWFVFRMVFNLYLGEPEKILQFIFDWQLTDANFADKDPRQLAVWLYKPAMATLVFSLLICITFVSWFSYPLMAFDKLNWVVAKYRGREISLEYRATVNKLIVFVMLLAIVGTGMLPFLTSVIFLMISLLMYVSYKGLIAPCYTDG